MGTRTQRLVLGTRGSPLAIAQADRVADRLRAAHPSLEIEIVRITTSGDHAIDRPISELGGKGAFTKELDDALLAGDIDAAVHSLKDVPTELPERLSLAAIGHRATPFDVLLTRDEQILDELPEGSKIGTSSLRRRAQLLLYRPDLEVEDIRGNVETRWKKLEAGRVDGIVLAAAALERLGWQERVSEIFTSEVMIPAVGQGILAVVTREGDARVERLVSAYEDPAARIAARCERAFLRELEGGCQVPAGALAELQGSDVVIEGIIVSPDGVHVYRDQHQGRKGHEEAVGKRLAQHLLDQGGDSVVRALRSH